MELKSTHKIFTNKECDKMLEDFKSSSIKACEKFSESYALLCLKALGYNGFCYEDGMSYVDIIRLESNKHKLNAIIHNTCWKPLIDFRRGSILRGQND